MYAKGIDEVRVPAVSVLIRLIFSRTVSAPALLTGRASKPRATRTRLPHMPMAFFLIGDFPSCQWTTVSPKKEPGPFLPLKGTGPCYIQPFSL
jgi:hypothetical protein